MTLEAGKNEQVADKPSIEGTAEVAKEALPNIPEDTAKKVLGPTLESMQQADIQALTERIDNDPKLQDPKGNKISELLKKGKIMEAISVGFSIIFNSIFGDGKSDTKLFFPQFSHLDEDIKKMNLSAKDISALEALMSQFDTKIDTANSVKRKISYTYILSAIKFAYEQKKNPNISLTTSVEKELDVGTVILLNKQKAGVGGKLLQGVNEDGVSFTHVIVITEKGPPPKFSHATEHKFSNSAASGVETNVPLWDYLKDNYADIVITQPAQEAKLRLQSRLPALKSDEQLQYSQTAAATGVIGMNDIQKGKYNCGTYVQEVLGLDGKGLAVPANWLSSSKMRPSLMFTFDPSKMGS